MLSVFSVSKLVVVRPAKPPPPQLKTQKSKLVVLVKSQVTGVLILARPPLSYVRLLNLPVPLFPRPHNGWS